MRGAPARRLGGQQQEGHDAHGDGDLGDAPAPVAAGCCPASMEADEDGAPDKLLAVTEETPQFKNISIRDVNCKGAYQGILLQGLPEMNLENIRLENILMEADYGMTCTDAKNVKIKNLTLITKHTPAVDITNSLDVSIEGLIVQPGEFPLIQVSGARTRMIDFHKAGLTNSDQQLSIGKEVAASEIRLAQ